MAHGSGGIATSQLISEVFAKHYNNDILCKMEDSAVVPSQDTIAITTDSFVVNPLFFKGGDIGKLSICGTVNDLLMSGAIPKYITCGFIIEEGASFDDLDKIAASMALAAAKAGVKIVAGDTKVIEGNGGIYINTSGVGFMPKDRKLSSASCKAGDKILLSGSLGNHHATILSARMNINNSIESDCQTLCEPVKALFDAGICIKAMRDVTRGGLATVLNEISDSCNNGIEIIEQAVPVDEQVQAFCSILGLNPLYMGNEGKFIAIIPEEDSERAEKILTSSPEFCNAKIIGTVIENKSVRLVTKIGGVIKLDVLYGEGLPRIC